VEYLHFMPQISNHLLSVLKKFDSPGPRYTSYPSAPFFSADYNAENFKNDLLENNRDNKTPMSLYLHIPFCDSLCHFCGCNTIVTKSREKISEYISFLKKETLQLASTATKQRSVVQIAWGGGSPSYLTPAEVLDLSGFVKQNFNVSANAEISTELDPRDLSPELLQAFVEGGTNRFSVGVQDLTPEVLEAVNRRQPEELTYRAFKWLRGLGIESINVDLVYGLPLQTTENFGVTLEKIVGLSPDRIAVFNFAYVPWIKPHQKLIDRKELPTPDEKLRLQELIINKLQNAGYIYIGMDHFAKPEDELALGQKARTLHRNFQGYSIKAGTDLFGLGLSAISHFGGVYAQNAKDLQEYYSALNRGSYPTVLGYKMGRDDEIRKYVIMRLMCDLAVDKREVEEKFDIGFDRYFSDAMEKLREFLDLHLVSAGSGHITVSDTGRFVLRNIAMCFDAYLPKVEKEKQIFSRTV
jgi:oxygen-independent coproporphyrinogen-3 oxidase